MSSALERAFWGAVTESDVAQVVARVIVSRARGEVALEEARETLHPLVSEAFAGDVRSLRILSAAASEAATTLEGD